MRMFVLAPFLLSPIALSGCGPGALPDSDGAADDGFRAGADGTTVQMEEDGTLTWTTQGRARRVRLGFGTVASPDAGVNYDPWNLYDPSLGGAPDGYALRWADALEPREKTPLWAGGDELGRVVVEPSDEGLGLELYRQGPDDDEWAPYVALAVQVEPDEEFYGLGEWFDGVRHRGHVHPMQFEIDTARESGYNEAHVPVPLLVSSASWGVVAEEVWPGVVDVAATDEDDVVFLFGRRRYGHTRFGLYAPPTPAEVVERYHGTTGLPETPPTWAFAPLQWRNEVSGSADVRADAAAIRENGIPTGTIWVDNPWQTTYNSMVPDVAMFPDWDALVSELHDDGFRMMAWTTPYVEASDPEHEAYAAAGWFVDAPLLLSDFGELVDLTHPDAAAAWTARAAAAYARGIEGWKLDYGEDVQVGLGSLRLRWSFSSGEDERDLHHRFAMRYHAPYAAAQDGEGMLLGRGGCLGGHTVTDVIWPGDLDSDFERWDDDCYGDGLCVGGLPSAIRAGTGLAMSGYPYFASDTGGFRHDRPTKEALIRWAEYSATLPIMQYGGGGDDHNPWNFTDYGASHYDVETVDLFRRYAQLHVRLFPYFWGLAERNAATGAPLVLPQGLAYPEAAVHTDDTYLVGPDLFVAPVEVAGATSRAVTLPPGAWLHWWSAEVYSGTVTVDAPLGQGPLFQRVGSVVPMLRDTVMTLSPAAPGVDSWASDAGRLTARVVPGDGAAFTLSTGESVQWSGDTATLTAGSLYAGWRLDVYLPGGTTVLVDGVPVPQGVETDGVLWDTDGTWVNVVLDDARPVTVR